VWFRPEDHRVVGECLAALRKGQGVTQSAFAESLGKPQSFVSSYEHGQRRLDVLEFLHIVEALRGDAVLTFADVLLRRKSKHRVLRRYGRHQGRGAR
jgi:transcriptional regulator with XRE-family HTH domain